MFSRKRKNSEHTPGTDDEFIAHKIALYQMCGMDDTVYNFYDKRSQCVPRPLSAVLVNLHVFGNMREHFKRISEIIRGIDESVFNDCIKDLHESGLLITKKEALSKLRSLEFRKNEGTISTAAWITRDRPESLLRSMESFTANFRRYGHAVRIFVSDDSPDDNASDDLSNRLAAVAKRESIPVVYMGIRDRRKLRDTIFDKGSPDGLPAHVLDFALFGLEGAFPSHGANRNAVLLANAGEMLLCTDDDVNCDLRFPESDGHDFELATRLRADIMESYPDRDALVRARPSTSADLLSLHARLLGRHTAELLVDFNDDDAIKLKSLLPEHIALLLSEGGTVSATVAGISGDSGLHTPRFVFRLNGEARERYTASESILRDTLRSREIFMSASHFAVASNTNFPGMNIGLDNRGILPPFIPVMRGEDTIFSRMINLLAHNSLIGTLPVTITHTPEGRRIFDEQAVFNVRPLISDLVVIMLDTYSAPTGTRDPRACCGALGNYLAGIGALPLDDFEEYMKELWLSWGAYATQNLEMLLKEHDYQPPFWADLLEKYAISIRDHTYSHYISAVQDIPADDEKAAALACRDIVRRYGELIRWWPSIYDAARDIRGNR